MEKFSSKTPNPLQDLEKARKPSNFHHVCVYFAFLGLFFPFSSAQKSLKNPLKPSRFFCHFLTEI